VEDNYKKPYKCNINLYAAFIRRCWELVHGNGKVAMVNPPTYMFIKSFEEVRKFMLEKTHIDLFVHWGYLGMFASFARVDSCMFILDKQKNSDKSCFVKLDDLYEGHRKAVLDEVYIDLCEGRENGRIYKIEQDKLRQIKSYPFIYWISDDFREKFAGNTVDDFCGVYEGVKSGNNEAAMRYHWEVNYDESKYCLYTKGGPYNKWYGNVWLYLTIADDYSLIKSQRCYNIPSVKFKNGITYAKCGSKSINFRFLDNKTLYDSGACAIYPNDIDVYYALGVLNSKISVYSVDCLNPTVNNTIGDIKRLPLVKTGLEKSISKIVQNIIQIKSEISKFSIIEPLFECSPIRTSQDAKSEVRSFFEYENAELTKVLLYEAIVNDLVFQIYNLTDKDRQMVLEKDGKPVGMLPVSQMALDVWTAKFGKLEYEVEGKTRLFIIEISEDQPHLDFETLYQANNEWEEFCIRNNVNPIEAWFQFKNSNVLPAQRTQTLAFELVTDVIRTLLDKDDDGVIPLVERTGEGTLTDRIQQEMIERGYSIAQFSQIVNLLGMPLDRYLRDRFFAQLSDHLNLFMYLPKTPFIWHITSGPLHAMELYVSIYKWNRNTLSRLKSVYCANRESSLRDRLGALSQSDAPEAQTEAADIRAQLCELDEFAKKLDDLLATGYDPKLDDGVGKNIAPLQQAGLLSYAVLKETGGKKSQLYKFLHADW
jgi:hypothetical protein